MRKSLKSPNNVAEKVSLKPTLDTYGISSQHFDTSLKLLLFVTKFNRAKLIVSAFLDYNFAENSNSLRSQDFQESRFKDVWLKGQEFLLPFLFYLVLVEQ